MEKIDKLTEEQEKMMDEIAEQAIKNANCGDTSYDTEKILALIDFLLENKDTQVFICQSPEDMFIVAEELGYKKSQGETFDYLGIGYDSGWTTFYEFMEKIGVDLSDIEDWGKWKLIKESGIWATMLFENIALVCIRPSFVLTNADGFLHCENGPAIGWIDGSCYYYLNGIPMEEHHVMTPVGKMNPKEILEEKNIDVQRELIRKIGAERMLKSLDSKCLDIFIDRHENRGNEYKLMEMKIGSIDRKYLYYEHASLPGVFYAQPVPPTIKKAIHARAWMLSIGEVEELEKMSDNEIEEKLPIFVS